MNDLIEDQYDMVKMLDNIFQEENKIEITNNEIENKYKNIKKQGGKISLNKTTKNRKSGCGYPSAAKSVDHERYVVVLKTRCVIDAKICILKERSLKTVIALEKNVFHHQNIAYLKKCPYLNEH